MKKEKITKIWKILLTIFILAVIGVGVYFILSNGILTKKEAQIEQLDTTNWQTYTNQRYGYSIKYPRDWFINNNHSEEDYTKRGGEDVGFSYIGGDTYWSNYSGYYSLPETPADYQIISLLINKSDESFQDIVKRHEDDEGVFDKVISDIQGNGLLKYKFITTSHPMGVQISVAIVKIDGGIMTFTYQRKEKDMTKIFDAMIDSLSFIDNEPIGSLSGKEIIARSGEMIYFESPEKSPSVNYNKIYIIAKDEDGNEKVIYTFNDNAVEEEKIDRPVFFDFDPVNKKILLEIDTEFVRCGSSIDRGECYFYEPDKIERGIYNLDLQTGALEQVLSFLKISSPEDISKINNNTVYPSGVGYNNGVAYDSEKNEFYFTERYFYNNEIPSLAIKKFNLENKEMTTLFSWRKGTSVFPFGSKTGGNMGGLTNMLDINSIDYPMLCLYVSVHGYEPTGYYEFNTEDKSIKKVSQCSDKTIEENFKLFGNFGYPLKEIVEKSFGIIK